MQHPDETNLIFKTAAQFINNTNHPVFLTGKAGTGKTTFLKFIRENTTKNTAIVAPTGVAAINAGGTTIHSFFQLPFGPYLPLSKRMEIASEAVDKHSLLAKIKLGTERKEVMQQLELLIIDEISMVRCDVLDAMDYILRHVRNRYSRPFGGVQVLYIGDMYQLPPVIKEDEWKILVTCYPNPFFFCSQVVTENPPIYIELQKVYRQRDHNFLDLLNQVRNNEMGIDGDSLLHSRYFPGYIAGKDEKVITLTTHNNKADAINISSLASLKGQPFSFEASVEGEFSEKFFPADFSLQLKVGAQVMFIKNDIEKIRRYFNGKIGTINKIEDEKLWVSLQDDGQDNIIGVKKEIWQNIRYTLNKNTQQIEEEVIGSFTQYPLRLAWAITIHKSQGLTFQNVMIDAESAFAPGQVYVALSRCTTLRGIILKSKISYNSLRSDDRIVSFSKNQQSSDNQNDLLDKASHQYQCETIISLVDFQKEENLITDLSKWVIEHPVFGEGMKLWFSNLKAQISLFQGYSVRFKNILNEYFEEDMFPEENESLQARLVNAFAWFYKELGTIKKLILKSPAITDNRQSARDYNRRLERFFDVVCFHLHILSCCQQRFSMTGYQVSKKSFIKDLFTVDAYSGKAGHVPTGMEHPYLYYALKDKRNELCERDNLPVYMVCSFKGIQEMASCLPQSAVELASISGFGQARIKRYGKDFLPIIINYCDLHGLKSNISILPQKRKKLSVSTLKKNDTKAISYDLYRTGKSIDEIAKERELTIATIENHLAHYIKSGAIEINDLVPVAKQDHVRKLIAQNGMDSLQKIKDQSPDSTYSEIRWIIASEKYNANHVR